MITNYYNIEPNDKLEFLERELVEFRELREKIGVQKEMINKLRTEKEIMMKDSHLETKEVVLNNENDIVKEIENMKKKFEERSNRYNDMVVKLKEIVYNK